MNYTYCSKSDLAQLYFADLNPRTALNKLMLLINSDRTLLSQLSDTGYRTHQHHLTPRQLQLITDRLGQP